MPNPLKIACVNFKDLHLLDHIAPLSYILDVPLYVEDEKNYNLIKKYYPFVNAIYQNPIDFPSLVQKYNALFENKFWTGLDLYKSLFNPEIKFLFCPHGNSDKGFIQKELLNSYSSQDGVLLYGDHMIDMLKKQNIFNSLSSYAVIGNFRLTYYLKFKKYYDKFLSEDKIFSKLDPKKKTILYAPTWKDAENSTSFFDLYEKIIKNLSSKYNLIIKLHPLLEERNPVEFYKIYENNQDSNVVQLTDFPLIYPLLNKCDIYLGDFSSVGYDFLYFQKPMFFLDPFARDLLKNPSLSLHNCGIQIPKNNWDNIFNFISQNLKQDFSIKQKKTYEYAFGNFLSVSQTKKNILKII